MTIGLKAVDNPLEFGIVVTDEDGRVERFLEKPSWGQVFSDTINTGIYVLEPEVLDHVPTDRPYDFSKELFPLLLEMGRPIYGCVLDGYWQDIGNLDQYRQANFDALDERVNLNIGGIRIRGNVWIGDGVDVARPRGDRGAGLPRQLLPHLAATRRSARTPSSRRASPSASGARTSHSIVDASTYIGRSTVVEGAIVGRSCDLRAHVRVHEGVAIGDEVTVGAESVIMPGVRIYPYKEVETGSQIFESLIWESRGTTRVFGKDGVSGMVNVDLTPDIGDPARGGVRHGAEARRARRREPRGHAGLPDDQAGDDLRPLLDRGGRRRPAGDPRRRSRAISSSRRATAAGFHVGQSPNDPEVIRIQFFEQPGIEMTARLQTEVEKHFTRGELRRVSAAEVGTLSYPARIRESYASDLLATVDARRSGGAASASSSTTASPPRRTCFPSSLGPLGVEAVAAHAFPSESAGAGARASPRRSRRRSGSCRRSARSSAPSSTRPASASTSSTSRRARSRSSRRSCSIVSLIALERPPREARVPRDRDEPGRPARRGHRSSRSSARPRRCRR